MSGRLGQFPVYAGDTHIGDKGRLQHAGLQTLEVDGSENGMSFDLRGSVALAAQPHHGIFGQQLEDIRTMDLFSGSSLSVSLLLNQEVLEDSPSRLSTHHLAEGHGVLRELAGIFLLHLPHQLLHFLPLDLLFPLLKGRLALDHLVQQAAQRPPVGAERVALVFHHLRRWRTRRRGGPEAGRRPRRPAAHSGLLTHVPDRPHPSFDGLSLRYVNG